MGSEQEEDLIKDLLNVSEFLESGLGILLLFGGAFVIYFFALSGADYNLKELSVRGDALVQKSAQEVITEMQTVSLYTVCSGSMLIEDWPRAEDVVFLLSVVDSQEKSGVFFSCYRSIRPKESETFSTVGQTALILLGAIRDKSLDLRNLPVTVQDREEIIAWARAEAEKMKAEQALKPR